MPFAGLGLHILLALPMARPAAATALKAWRSSREPGRYTARCAP